MKFKADEKLPIEVADLFRAAGHDAQTVPEENITGADDDVVYAVAQLEQRVVLTLDLDFADIREYPPETGAGIIVLRLASDEKEYVLNFMPRVLRLLETEPISGCLCVMDETRTRIRRNRR